jgi:hypothetical protein
MCSGFKFKPFVPPPLPPPSHFALLVSECPVLHPRLYTQAQIRREMEQMTDPKYNTTILLESLGEYRGVMW